MPMPINVAINDTILRNISSFLVMDVFSHHMSLGSGARYTFIFLPLKLILIEIIIFLITLKVVPEISLIV